MTKGPESTAQFLTLALSESDTEKIIGLALLGEVGDPDYPGVREVVGRELSSRNYGVRIQAINAVGRLGYREYLPRIYQLLMTGHEEAERILEWVPYLPMLPYLEKRYASWDKDAKELFGLFPDHWLLSGMRDATYNFLMENIDNPDPRYAAAVITAMGSTGDKSSFLPLIVSKMTSSADGRVQKAIIESIRQLADCPEEASILNKVELGGWLRIRADQVLRFLKWKDENKRR
jgi:HEAT repeat protein